MPANNKVLLLLFIFCYCLQKILSASVVCCMLQQSFDWMNESCLNNLNDVYQQYCKDARPLEKHMRDVFVTGTVDDVVQNFQVSCTFMHWVLYLPVSVFYSFGFRESKSHIAYGNIQDTECRSTSFMRFYCFCPIMTKHCDKILWGCPVTMC